MVAKLADCHAETKRKMEEEKKGWLVFAAKTFHLLGNYCLGQLSVMIASMVVY